MDETIKGIGQFLKATDSGVTVICMVKGTKGTYLEKTGVYFPYGSITEFGKSFGAVVFKGEKSISAPFYYGDKKRQIKELLAKLQVLNSEAPKTTPVVLDLEKEHKISCKTCGCIFCYTYADICENSTNETRAAAYKKSADMHALFGSSIVSNLQDASAEQYLKDVNDFSRCPKCHSTELAEIDDNPAEAKVSVSSAEEIKKFKELLDIGAITQAEFDAKKKQLLGL